MGVVGVVDDVDVVLFCFAVKMSLSELKVVVLRISVICTCTVCASVACTAIRQ